MTTTRGYRIIGLSFRIPRLLLPLLSAWKIMRLRFCKRLATLMILQLRLRLLLVPYRNVLLYRRRILPVEEVQQLLSLVMFTPMNVLRRCRKREPALGDQLAQAPRCRDGKHSFPVFIKAQS